MKRDPAIIVFDMPCGFEAGVENAVANTEKFINASGCEGDKDEEILDTCPVFFVRGCSGSTHPSLGRFIDEDLTFVDGVNGAGQSLGEILEMMDTKNVYICGTAEEATVRKTCMDLRKSGLTIHLLADGLACGADTKKVLDGMASEGMILE